MLIVPLTPVRRLFLSCLKLIYSTFHSLRPFAISTEENLALSFGCEETLAGLYHTLNVMGESLLTMAGEKQERMSNESVCQLGHSLMNISQLIPALAELEAKADQQLFAMPRIA